MNEKLSKTIRMFKYDATPSIMEGLAEQVELLEQRIKLLEAIVRGGQDDNAIISEVERLCDCGEFGAAIELANEIKSKVKWTKVSKLIKEYEALC